MKNYTTALLYVTNTKVKITAGGETFNSIKYGGQITIKSYTSINNRKDYITDKGFIFVESNIERIKAGKQDGAAKKMSISAAAIARAAGGVDGTTSVPLFLLLFTCYLFAIILFWYQLNCLVTSR